MIRLRVLFTSAALWLVAGCAAVNDPADDPSGTTRAAIQVEGGGAHLARAGEVFADVPLDAAQRAEIEALFEAAATRHAPGREARRALVEELAAQLEAGRLDRGALAREIDAVAAAMNAAREADREAIQRLHATLDADQREALVDAIEDRVEARFGGEGRERLREVAERLALTEDQRDAIQSALRERFDGAGWRHARDAMRRGREALDAFREDDFSIDAVWPAVDRGARLRDRSEKMLDAAEVVLPLLTPAQQKTAARLLRERADELAP